MIEVGEYIRTKTGLIFKATEYWLSELTEEIKENIKAHSKSIIDLIEKGDYVNGYLVGGISDNGETAEKEIMIEIPYEKTYNKHILNEEIKTILTHEQYEQNCYKL